MIVTEKSISRQASMEACLFAIQKAEELKIAINVSIADNKGLEMAFLRMENSFIHSSEIAKDKAYTSASFGFPTDTWTSILGYFFEVYKIVFTCCQKSSSHLSYLQASPSP